MIIHDAAKVFNFFAYGGHSDWRADLPGNTIDLMVFREGKRYDRFEAGAIAEALIRKNEKFVRLMAGVLDGSNPPD